MKPRKLIITIETETNLPIKVLKQWKGQFVGTSLLGVSVEQIQVNVVNPAKSPHTSGKHRQRP